MNPINRADQGLPLSGKSPTEAQVAKAEEAADQFEGYFIGQLLRQMRSGTKEIAGDDSIYGSETNQDMLDMADVALGNSLAGQHAFGIADAVLKQLLPAGAAGDENAALAVEPAAAAAAAAATGPPLKVRPGRVADKQNDGQLSPD